MYFVVIPAGNNFNARYLMLMQSRLLLTFCYVLLSGTLLAQSVPPIFNLSAGFYATEQIAAAFPSRSDVVIHYNAGRNYARALLPRFTAVRLPCATELLTRMCTP